MTSGRQPKRHGGDRVRENSDADVNAGIDRELHERVRRSAGQDPAVLTGSIEELEREWDIERYLETLAPTLSLSGIALAARGDRRWLIAPGRGRPFYRGGLAPLPQRSPARCDAESLRRPLHRSTE